MTEVIPDMADMKASAINPDPSCLFKVYQQVAEKKNGFKNNTDISSCLHYARIFENVEHTAWPDTTIISTGLRYGLILHPLYLWFFFSNSDYYYRDLCRRKYNLYTVKFFLSFSWFPIFLVLKCTCLLYPYVSLLNFNS